MPSGPRYLFHNVHGVFALVFLVDVSQSFIQSSISFSHSQASRSWSVRPTYRSAYFPSGLSLDCSCCEFGDEHVQLIVTNESTNIARYNSSNVSLLTSLWNEGDGCWMLYPDVIMSFKNIMYTVSSLA